MVFKQQIYLSILFLSLITLLIFWFVDQKKKVEFTHMYMTQAQNDIDAHASYLFEMMSLLGVNGLLNDLEQYFLRQSVESEQAFLDKSREVEVTLKAYQDIVVNVSDQYALRTLRDVLNLYEARLASEKERALGLQGVASLLSVNNQALDDAFKQLSQSLLKKNAEYNQAISTFVSDQKTNFYFSSLVIILMLSWIAFLFSRFNNTSSSAQKMIEDQAEVAREKEVLYARLMEKNSKLENINAELESFSHSVSHDLRTPLRSIDGFSHLLESEYDKKMDRRGREYLKRIRQAALRMGSLIDSLLALSRLTRGEMNVTDVNLSQVFWQVSQDMIPADSGSKVTLTVADGMKAQGDLNLLRIVVENLLSNAWKFSCERQAVNIEVGVKAVQGGHCFYVKDNGAGFDMSFKEKLFKPFQRLHSEEKYRGSGIGLATVERIVKRHNGKIWAESAPGEGAVFYFTLACIN